MAFGDGRHDGQAEARPTRGSTGLKTMKALQHGVPLLPGNPRAIVGHAEYRIVADVLDADGDHRAGQGVPQRVLQQVGDRLGDQVCIAVERGGSSWQAEPPSAGLDVGPVGVGDAGGQFGQVDRSEAGGLRVVLDLGQAQHGVQGRAEFVDVRLDIGGSGQHAAVASPRALIRSSFWRTWVSGVRRSWAMSVETQRTRLTRVAISSSMVLKVAPSSSMSSGPAPCGRGP